MTTVGEPVQAMQALAPWGWPPAAYYAAAPAYMAGPTTAPPCGCSQHAAGPSAPAKADDPFGAPLYPPLDWFDPVNDSEPVDKVKITDEGQVRGYWWTHGSCLLDGSGECWQPPPSPTGYAAFHQGDTLCLDQSGKEVYVHTGAVGMDTTHANPYLDWTAASEHYANTGLQVVVVRLGDNRHGGWLAGSLVPEVTHGQVARMRRSAMSGDWRFFPRLIGKSASGWDSLGPIFVTRPGLPIDRSVPAGHSAAVGEFGLVAVFGGFGRPWQAFTAAGATSPADAFTKARQAVLEAYSAHAEEGGWQPNPQGTIEHFASTNGVALWKVTDGYGEWFFAGNQDGVVWLCQKMPDVAAFAANEKLYPLTAKQVADMGWDDFAWQSWMIEQVNKQRPKGAGVYNTGDSPLVTVSPTDPLAELKKTQPTPDTTTPSTPPLVAPPIKTPVVAATLAAVLAAGADAADQQAVKAAWDAWLVTMNFDPNAAVEAPVIEMIGQAADSTKVWEVANSRGRWYLAGDAKSDTGVRILAQVMVDYSSVTPAPGLPTIPDNLVTKVYDVQAWRSWVVQAMNANSVLSENQGNTAPQEGTMPETTPTAAVAAPGDSITAGDTVSVDGRDGTFLVVAIASLPDGGTYAVLDDGSGVPIEQCSKVDMPAPLSGDTVVMSALGSALEELRLAAARYSAARTAADPMAPMVDPMAGMADKLDAILAALGAITDMLGAKAPPAPAPAPAGASEVEDLDAELADLAAALA